jgi:hypothetical protein
MATENRLIFAFAVHDHQPVGNFKDVIARVYRRAYEPFLKAASRYPQVSFSLHISGSLLEWMEEDAPETIELARGLVARGQCEILTGTYYESLAPVAPEEDVKRSIRAYTAKLAEVFGIEAEGMWLAERVYEPHLPAVLSAAGVRFVALDDWHFRVAGIPPEDLGRPWIAEHQGAIITACPISQRLRYLVPFAPVPDVIGHLRGAYEAGADMVCLADDGEKFGEWPGTFEHCYTQGWLEEFFGALVANADWLRVATLGEAVATVPAAGPAYLPATSYYEMTRWALPTASQRRLKDLGPDFAVDGADGDLVTGGAFRSFFQKYEEANFFHKRVQETSRRFYEAAAQNDAEYAAAQRHLWRAQANDAYWHGVFGGFYLPHLRRGVKHELLRAEALLDRKTGRLSATEYADFDADGVAELTLKNDNVVAVLKANGLSVAEFARRSPPAVLTDVPARRPELYHDDVRRGLHSEGAGAAKTIHGDKPTKEAGLERYLVYDRRPKRLFLERIFDGAATLDEYAREAAVEFADFSWGDVTKGDGRARVSGSLGGLEGGRAAIRKELALMRRGIETVFSVQNGSSQNVIFGLELTLSITSDNPEYSLFDGWGKYEMGSIFETETAGRCRITDRLAEWQLDVIVEGACNLWHSPVYTVSCTESGYEKVYQGSAFFFWWPLAPGGELLSRVAAELI